MKALLILASFVLFATAVILNDTPIDCTFTVDGHTYDFSSLSNPSEDYTASYQSGIFDVKLWLNLCRPVVSTPCNDPQSACCQQWDPTMGPEGMASLGNAYTQNFTWGTQINGREGITAFFTDGQVNWEGKARSMQIDFVCNATAGKGEPVFYGEPWLLHYVFTWQTNLACEIQCNQQPNCGDCTDSGCVWCNDDNACSREVGTCSNWISDEKYCPIDPCSKFGSCVDCTAKGFGQCGWCLDDNVCIGKSQENSCRNLVNDIQYCPISKVKIN